MAALALLNAIGWSMYGMSQTAKKDVEDRLRAVEITLSSLSTSVNSLAATMGERSLRRDAQIADIVAQIREQRRAGR